MPFEISFVIILSTLVYKPLDLDAWPKSRNGKKICRFNIFKLSIMFDRFLSGPPKNYKQYEVTISDYPTCNCMDFGSMMALSLSK